ncbi:MAG: hypothetical protein MK101_03645 [Phycisphaerales bacterium]|nr:hypothetical protein [Phycisphaerales bacterium]
MARQADIREVKAVGELRGRVVESAETLARLVDDCNSTMRRFVDWVTRDRASHWKSELRKRDQKLQTARSDLERAKIARPDADPRSFTDQIRALRRTKAALEEAQAKSRACKRWGVELERQALLLRAGLRPVSAMADAELPAAVRWLGQLEQHLQGYVAEAPVMPDALEDADAATPTASRARSGEVVNDPKEPEQ